MKYLKKNVKLDWNMYVASSRSSRSKNKSIFIMHWWWSEWILWYLTCLSSLPTQQRLMHARLLLTFLSPIHWFSLFFFFFIFPHSSIILSLSLSDINSPTERGEKCLEMMNNYVCQLWRREFGWAIHQFQ